jgi:hypothetical protein
MRPFGSIIMGESRVFVIRVRLEDRPDGGLRVYSENLIGLVLSGPSRAVVCAQIATAIKALFCQAGFEGVTVNPARPLSEVMKEGSPRDVDMHVQEFVVELADAA